MIFALILMSVTGLTGLIYLLDVIYLKKKREQGRKEPIIIEYSKSFFPVLLAVFVIRSFIVEPFKIPSGSMMPTLIAGDFIAVNKFSYGVRFPVINNVLIPNGKPERGDVAVFHYPRDTSIDYIKRVIGLPGDTVKYENKKLYINDELVPYIFEKDYEYTMEMMHEDFTIPAKEYTETLGEVRHSILIHSVDGESGTFIVPEGNYFVMGDNRDNSSDSRVWGFVSDELLVGKAFIIWLNLSEPSRIGTTIK